jgi:DNA-directed RNA polymerase specialized sigma24 family protein
MARNLPGVSPLSVRRYRAERLLRREFEGMRARVLALVRARLRAAGVRLDPADLDACYSQAWHGLYTTMLEGRTEVANPEGWLALVTYRRAIDEHRARVRSAAYTAPGARHDPQAGPPDSAALERDLAGELDDRTRLRQLMEGLRGRLGPRERQAAALCYLQGRSRAQAAAQMGLSEARMRKLMDGRPGSPGVAAKVGQLLETIRAGSYCAEQASLMRGFAFGILDPDGERYALAVAHQRECPACRAHVLSLRGLAAVLPPLPLPLALGAGVAAGAGAGGVGAGAGTSASLGTGTSVGSGVGATGAAGGAAGGGWLLAGGGVAGKLAVGCLLAVGVGASCVALSIAPPAPHRSVHHRRAIHLQAPHGGYQALNTTPAAIAPVSAVSSTGSTTSTAASAASASRTFTPAARASREFGPEQPARGATATQANIAHSARVASAPSGESSGSIPASSADSADGSGGGGGSTSHQSGGPSSATREFGLG